MMGDTITCYNELTKIGHKTSGSKFTKLFKQNSLDILVPSSYSYKVWNRALIHDFYYSYYQPLIISTFRNNLVANNKDIFRLKITKILRIWLTKFCEYYYYVFGRK